jgi:hypothetical protein
MVPSSVQHNSHDKMPKREVFLHWNLHVMKLKAF